MIVIGTHPHSGYILLLCLVLLFPFLLLFFVVSSSFSSSSSLDPPHPPLLPFFLPSLLLLHLLPLLLDDALHACHLLRDTCHFGFKNQKEVPEDTDETLERFVGRAVPRAFNKLPIQADSNTSLYESQVRVIHNLLVLPVSCHGVRRFQTSETVPTANIPTLISSYIAFYTSYPLSRCRHYQVGEQDNSSSRLSITY